MSLTPQQIEWSNQLARAFTSNGYVEPDAMSKLVEEAQVLGSPVGELLVSRGLVPASIVLSTMAQLSRLPAVDLRTEPPTAEAMRALPEQLGRAHRGLAQRVVSGQMVVCFAEPPEARTVRSMSDLTGFEVVPALGEPIVIDWYLNGGRASVIEAAAPAAQAAAPVGTPAPPGTAAPADQPSAPLSDQAVTAGPTRHAAPMDAMEIPHIDDLLRYTVSIGASDMHLISNMPPTVRLHGALRPMEDMGRLDNTTLREMVYGILPQAQRERFEAEHELDTSHTIAGVGRFRVNVALQRGTITAALRPIPHEIPNFESLGIPEIVRGFCDLRRGLVLVTGPTGSGKSTTLASLIDIINRTKPLHIVTIEDPIEFLHMHKRSLISQREVGSDTASFAEALRRVLRQDPDVILVGELRDLETISTALTAAETGHLVFATLHTQDAPSTIDRIIDVFPPNQQDQIRIQLGSSLQGVVTQQLVPTADGQGRCCAAEVLVCTSAVANLIRGAKTHQIYSIMQTGGQFGMQTMDQSLALLVKQRIVSRAVAQDRARSEEDFLNHMREG